MADNETRHSGYVPQGGCICTWEQPPEEVVPLSSGVWVQTKWEPTCPFDGEGTANHARTVEYGREVAARLGWLDESQADD
jgi:hypothetical protein